MKGWRSVLFHGGVVAGIGALKFFADVDILAALGIPPGIATMAAGVIGVLLRKLTTGPVGTKV